MAGTKAAGRAIAIAAKRVKTPLAIGGGAVAGVAGGLAIRNRRNGSRLANSALGKSLLDGKLDADAVASAAQRVESLGKQMGMVAAALRSQQSKK